MCGIIGIIANHQRLPDQTKAELRMMASRLQHRGPDGAGFMVAEDGRVGLAQTRLSIVDLEGGQQPLVNEDGQLILVANGEIYDYDLWKKELISRGHQFATGSDSELILHLYEEFGIDCLSKLNGEFAFILWDGRRQHLYAGGDIFGIKPLFYTQVDGTVYLASEVKGLFALSNIPRSMNPTYFVGPMLGSLSQGVSPFAGIHRLKPGHYLSMGRGAHLQEHRYHRPEFTPDTTMSFTDATKTCRELLTNAVSRRLRADVPVHLYLSGGLDSTGIAVLLKNLGHRPKAFSVGFLNSEMDESAAIKKSGRDLGFEVDLLTCNADQLADNLTNTLWATEAPIGNLNSVAKFLLSQYVHRQGVKVCLTGEGADELFCGYPIWKLETILRLEGGDRSDRLKARRFFRDFISRESRNEGIMWSHGVIRHGRKSARFYGFPSYYRSYSERMDSMVSRLLSPDFRKGEPRFPSMLQSEAFPQDLFKDWAPENITRGLALGSLASYIIPNLGDRVEMANSLECRTPYMDTHLLEFLQRVPPEYLLHIDQEQMREKYLLYESLADLLPRHVYQGHKHPFLSPSWQDFAKTKYGKDLIDTFLNPNEIQATGIFQAGTIQKMRALWQILPKKSPLRKTLDISLGGVLTSQILHRLFVKDPPAAQKMDYFVERTATGWPTKSLGVVHTSRAAIPPTLPPNNLSEWQNFVLRHQNPANIWVHFVSFLCFMGGPILALLTANILWFGLFMISGLIGTAGHYVFRDGGVSVREATFQLSVPYFVGKMLYQIVTGTYQRSTLEAKASQARIITSQNKGNEAFSIIP